MKTLKAAKLVLVEDEENRFERLPDAMVIEILNKLVHAKHILRCSSVCKRFGSLIYQIQKNFIPGLACRPSSLNKFSAISYIQMEFEKPSPEFHKFPGSFIQYKTIFRRARLDVFILIIAPKAVESAANDSYSREDGLLLEIARYILLFYSELHHDVFQAIISPFPLLDQALIDTFFGKLYTDGKDHIATYSEKFVAKILHARLELPVSGRVMQRAHIVVVRPEGEENVMGRDLGFMLSSFGSEFYEDHVHQDEVGKITDEVVNVVRKKVASSTNGDLITMHHLSLPTNIS